MEAGSQSAPIERVRETVNCGEDLLATGARRTRARPSRRGGVRENADAVIGASPMGQAQ